MGFQNSARTLASLAPGEGGRIAALQGRDALSLRLLEMGLIPGTELSVVKRAPFGDPIEIRVRGFHLSVRRREAERVELEASAALAPGLDEAAE